MKDIIVFVGNYTDEETYSVITSNGIRELSQAARLFQKRIINGFSKNNIEIKVFSLLPTNGDITLPESITDLEVPVSVLSYSIHYPASIKRIMNTLKNEIKELVKNDYRVSVVLYAVNPIAMLPLMRIKRKYKLSLTQICPELPQLRRYKKNIGDKVKKKFLIHFNKYFDKYVIFAEKMTEYLPKGRDYLVVEGVAPEYISDYMKREHNIALYAGGLAFDNGIEMMIKAANKSQLIDELWICGVGAALDYVKEHSNDKIKYLGRLTNNEVLNAEKKAKILLNVRNPDNSLTKYSFPSKILEYMSSAGIVVSSNLAGIPSEYHKYIYILSSYSADALAQSIDDIFSLDELEYRKFVEGGQEFIRQKTGVYQSRKILSFVLGAKSDEN